MSLEKEVDIGPEGKLDVKVEGGKLIISVTHVHASGQVSLIATEDAKYFLEKLKSVLPPWASIAIAAAEGALP